MNKEQNTKRILIFLGFAFGIPWAAALVIFLSGGLANNAVQAVGTANTFFIATPWLANIAARLVTREGWGNFGLRPNFKRGWPFYLAAWLLPLGLAVTGAAVFYLLYPQSFDPELGAVRALVGNSPEAAALSPWVILLSMTLSMVFISALINMVVSMGEELGWRAYLLPKLAARLGDERKAALLTGLIHGVWHWPLMLMGASLLPGFSVLTLGVYLVFTCSLSVLLAWVTLRSGSVWPAALGHGTANAFSALPGMLLKGQAVPLLGPDPTGLIGGVGYTLLALGLLLSRKAFARRPAGAAERAETQVSAG